MRDILHDIQKEMNYSNLDEALEMTEHYNKVTQEDLDDMSDAEYDIYKEHMDALEMAEKKHGHKLHVGHHKGHGHHRGHGHGHGHHRKAHPRTVLHGKNKLAGTGGGGSWSKNPESSPEAHAAIFGSAAYVQQVMAASVGDLNITVIRESANITATFLPYILFDLNGLTSSFVSTIKGYLPANIVSFSAAVDNTTGDLILTYTDNSSTPKTDTVRITLTGSQISYSEFLQNMNTNFFKTRYIRQEYPNDSNLLLSVSQTINFGLLSALGMKGANNLLPRSRRLSSDYQTFIINLFLPEQTITSDFSFVQKIQPIVNYTIAWDVFMSERINLNQKL